MEADSGIKLILYKFICFKKSNEKLFLIYVILSVFINLMLYFKGVNG